MPVLRERHTKQQIEEMRKRNEEMLKGISFSEEWLSKQPPVSKKRAAYLRKLGRDAWKKCFLSDEEARNLQREVGVDVHSRWKPENFCAWNWWEVSDDVRMATMLEF